MADDVPWPWISDYTENSEIFYLNQETGETSWELPLVQTDTITNENNFSDHGGEWNSAETSQMEKTFPQVDLPSTNAWGQSVAVQSSQEFEISYKVYQTPLFESCEKHDDHAVVSILDNVAYPLSLTQVVNQMNSAGMTALHVCCLFGSELCAVALLANRADVHAVDKFGSGCLHYISRSRNPSSNLVRLLLSYGCDVFFEEKLAHYTPREELVLEHNFLRVSPDIWAQRLEAFESSSPIIEEVLDLEVPPHMLGALPLPMGWEKYEDEIGSYFYCEKTDETTRDRPPGTTPKGAYEILTSNFNSYLLKCLPWYGGKGPSLKKGPVDYAADDKLWEERKSMKRMIVSALSDNIDRMAEDLASFERRTLECYFILRREELRRSYSIVDVDIFERISLEEASRPKKSILLGLCGYWNPLVAMKVLKFLMDKLSSHFEPPQITSDQTKMVGIKNGHIIQDFALPSDFEIASKEFDIREKRLTLLLKAQKTLRRLESEGKQDGEQATKLRKDIIQLKHSFNGAHRTWLSRIAIDVLPKRISLCEELLRDMGFSIPVVETNESHSNPSLASRVQTVQSTDDASLSVETTVSPVGDVQSNEEPPIEPPMPLSKWTSKDVAWGVYRRLPSSVALHDRRAIRDALIDGDITGIKLFPLDQSETVGDLQDEHPLPMNSTIYPTLDTSENLRVAYLVELLGFDNKLRNIHIATAIRTLLLVSKRWTQMNQLDDWETPTPAQEEDGKLLEHVLRKIAELLETGEDSLEELNSKLTKNKLISHKKALSSHSVTSTFSFMDAVHAKEAEILEQHVKYQCEQRQILHDSIDRFKQVLLPLPQISSANSPPTSPMAGL